ncbi:MAG: hypothetical protein JWO25_963 [Alphaproteobacteria bacterium]|nr:hypothetical protein [Alphaproteobacteria bacterium]
MNAESPSSPQRRASDPALPRPYVSDRLTPALVDAASAPRVGPSGRAVRADGWTPERIRIFLETLADCGVVTEAAAAAGMNARSAYVLRQRAEGRAFHIAWNAAQQLARRRVSDELMARAIRGSVELIVRDGEVVGERHRHDNRLALALMTRLDQQQVAGDEENVTARLVAQEYDEFLDLVCAGGEGADAFLESRRRAEGELGRSREVGLLGRLASYVRGRPRGK